MKAKDLRDELKSYGISTKPFFEKSELVEAVEKARKEGKKPIETEQTSESDSSGAPEKPRSERLAEEIDKCNKLKVKELKSELESYGISKKVNL